MSWPEITTARTEHKYDLVLTGTEVSQRLDGSAELPKELFDLRWLNFLEISRAGLQQIPGKKLLNLSHLTRLVLHSNVLSELPEELFSLSQLKHLDLSHNAITVIPVEISALRELQVLNISHNLIVSLPVLDSLHSLIQFNASYNQLTEFPLSLCNACLEHLSEIDVQQNRIVVLPAELHHLLALKTLHIDSNCVEVVPYEISDCLKLKELTIAGNKLKDRRLQKMFAECRLGSTMEYIRKSCKPVQHDSTEDKQTDKHSSKVPQKAKHTKAADVVEKPKSRIVVALSSNISISVANDVLSSRPYFVACVVHNLNLTDGNFKKFIKLQSRLHDTVCKKRVSATIATHDLKLVNFPLVYSSRLPAQIEIRPLRATTEITAVELVRQLNQEADQLRKEKKRNTYSGVHQYLYLLKPLNKYPVLLDGAGTVISLPPITNSDHTKISTETTDMLLEVTSAESLTVCKSVADAFLKELLIVGLGVTQNAVESENDNVTVPTVSVEQVRVLAEDQTLKVAYPSKTDLSFTDVEVIRGSQS